MTKARWLKTALAVAALSLVGCGDGYDASVSGVVTLGSAPLTNGIVTFTPNSTGVPAYSQIGAGGRYELHTGRMNGLNPGEYGVSVIATESTGSRGKDGGPPPMGKLITPEWYRDASTSGLTYTVQPGDNEINIELNTTPPPGWKPPTGRRR